MTLSSGFAPRRSRPLGRGPVCYPRRAGPSLRPRHPGWTAGRGGGRRTARGQSFHPRPAAAVFPAAGCGTGGAGFSSAWTTASRRSNSQPNWTSELELRAERQAEGIAAARRRQAEGRMLPGKKHIGRPKVTGPAEITTLRRRPFDDGTSVTQAARTLKSSRSTAHAALASTR